MKGVIVGGKHKKVKAPIKLTTRGEIVVTFAIIIGAWLGLVAFAWLMIQLNSVIN